MVLITASIVYILAYLMAMIVWFSQMVQTLHTSHQWHVFIIVAIVGGLLCLPAMTIASLISYEQEIKS